MLLVTGITGHSGRWFLKRLNVSSYPGKIRCIMRSSRETAHKQYSIFENCNLDLEFVVGDLNDETFLHKALKDVETMVHIAGISFSPALFAAAIKNGVNWMILVHTTGRYSKYKSASEGYIQIEDEILNKTIYAKPEDRSMNCTILRPTMIYGSSQDRNMYRLVEYLNTHRFFPLFGNGKNLMQPVHARDLGNAYYDVLHSPDITMNREYNLSGRDPLPYLKIIETIKKNLNSKVKIIKLPIKLSVFAARIYNAIFKNAIITVEQVLRMQEDKAFSHDDASKDFGYNPISFEEGIKDEIQEYLNGVRVDYSEVRY